MTHTLTIPDWTPVRTNQWYGKHWRVRHRLKRQQADMLAAFARQAGIPRATGKRRVTLTVYGWPGKRRLPDRDAYDKLLLDALRDCGLITDDDAEGLDGRLTVELVRGAERRTVITLEDVG